jgi:hypothetical protein
MWNNGDEDGDGDIFFFCWDRDGGGDGQWEWERDENKLLTIFVLFISCFVPNPEKYPVSATATYT